MGGAATRRQLMSTYDSHPSPPLQLTPARSTEAASDEAIVRGIAERSESAAVALWTRYGRLVYRLAERALGCPHEAEDLTQDVFLCLLSKVGGVRDATSLRSFVVSVTIRTLKWQLRRRRRRQWWVNLTQSGSLPELAVQGTDVDEALTRFYRLLDKLRADDRLIFVLRRVDGMQLQEVADSTGHSLATVKRRLVRADAQLSRWMEREPLLVAFIHQEGEGGIG
jgi:RNA polymerase sigma-70 factor, ECF subfamily